ncbi:MAG: hypothetical protein V1744_04660 [Candidatus Altiarchaeota archaeon]
MPLVDFDTVSDEIEDAGSIRVMQALIRSSLYHGADNRPAMLILSDKTLFYGGGEADGGRFRRVPVQSITRLAKVGLLIWECVELKHMEIEGERKMYICPFTGQPGRPRKDYESMEQLLKLKENG